jgi:hypothetical protein
MKYPKYVKCIKKWFVENSELNKIYDTSKPFPNHLQMCTGETWESVLSNKRYSDSTGWKQWFEESTKEEYCRQEGLKFIPDTPEDLTYLIKFMQDKEVI